MKIIYYLASSLDGLIADSEHGVGWLDQLNIDQKNTGCESFFESVDALLMGRKTFDFVYNFGQWPYGDKPTWVCSTRDVPNMDGCNLQDEREPVAAVEKARSLEHQSIWMVGGGQLAQSLLQKELLTHISISVMPVLLGQGIKLIDSLPSPIYLEQTDSTQMSGFTHIEYAVKY